MIQLENTGKNLRGEFVIVTKSPRLEFCRTTNKDFADIIMNLVKYSNVIEKAQELFNAEDNKLVLDLTNSDTNILYRGKVKMSELLTIGCKYFDLSIEEVSVKSRRHAILIPRQILQYLATYYTSATPEEVGFQIGRMTRLGVANSVKKIEELQYLPEIKKSVLDIKKLLSIQD